MIAFLLDFGSQFIGFTTRLCCTRLQIVARDLAERVGGPLCTAILVPASSCLERGKVSGFGRVLFLVCCGFASANVVQDRLCTGKAGIQAFGAAEYTTYIPMTGQCIQEQPDAGCTTDTLLREQGMDLHGLTIVMEGAIANETFL